MSFVGQNLVSLPCAWGVLLGLHRSGIRFRETGDAMSSISNVRFALGLMLCAWSGYAQISQAGLQGTVNDNLSRAGDTANRAYSYAGSAFSMYSHTGTHLCGLNHIGYHGRFWNGWTAETHLGSRSWKVGGVFPVIVARAVLVDVAGAKGLTCLPDSYSISREDILETLSAQRISIDHADIAGD